MDSRCYIMILQLLNNADVYFFAYVLFPLAILYNSNIFSFNYYNNHYLSKTNTTQIRGILIVIIILHHFAQSMTNVGLMFPFRSVGYLAVGMFFFYSGYGLMISKQNNSTYMDNFIQKRLSKVYYPFILINAITLVIYYYVLSINFSIQEILMYTIGFKLIDPITWYVILILFFYVIFYLCFKKFNNAKGIKLLFIISLLYWVICRYLEISTYWYNTSLCFSIGVFYSLYGVSLFSKIKQNYFIFSFMSILVFIITFALNVFYDVYGINIVIETMSSLAFILVTLNLSIKVNLSSPLLLYVGDFSYYMYLIHMKIHRLTFDYFNLDCSYSFYIYFSLVVIASFLINHLVLLVPLKPILGKIRGS